MSIMVIYGTMTIPQLMVSRSVKTLYRIHMVVLVQHVIMCSTCKAVAHNLLVPIMVNGSCNCTTILMFVNKNKGMQKATGLNITHGLHRLLPNLHSLLVYLAKELVLCI